MNNIEILQNFFYDNSCGKKKLACLKNLDVKENVEICISFSKLHLMQLPSFLTILLKSHTLLA